MINDFPETEHQTHTSLFADDSAIWRSGRNLNAITEKLKRDVHKIVQWCNEWGFRLNEKKTVAIIFTKNPHIRELSVPIELNNKQIETVKNVKFLGLTFDQRLSWTAHINNVVNSSKSKTNLLRSLSGQQWGAGKETLLRIYRTLIRPKLEYGFEVFNTATKAALKKLEVIQNNCLRIACGAMNNTSVQALQQECGELPMHLRMKQALLRYTAKISTSSTNPSREILLDSWENHYGRYRQQKGPIYSQVSDFLQNMQIQQQSVSTMSPWKRIEIHVDLSLQTSLKNIDNSYLKKQIVLNHLQQFDDHLHIYTDAARNRTGQTGASYYIPSKEIETGIRLPDNTCVVTAELLAIKSVLQFINTTKLQKMKLVLLTDSQGALQSLNSADFRYQTIETDISDIVTCINQLQNEIRFVWIPGHIDIEGNDMADQIAKIAAAKHNIDIVQASTIADVNGIIDEYIDQEWQRVYDASGVGKHYKTIEPFVSRKVKYTSYSRRQETTITRLRLGKCLLNYNLYKMNRHSSGLCA
jgi:ribonuclease HI